jgi:hypothetical protein
MQTPQPHNLPDPVDTVSDVEHVVAGELDEETLRAEWNRQFQRFRWFQGRMSRWIGYYDVDELADFAAHPPDWPGQREKAIVLLALTGTDAAIDVLESLDVSEDDPSFRLFREVARLHARSE